MSNDGNWHIGANGGQSSSNYTPGSLGWQGAQWRESQDRKAKNDDDDYYRKKNASRTKRKEEQKILEARQQAELAEILARARQRQFQKTRAQQSYVQPISRVAPIPAPVIPYRSDFISSVMEIFVLLLRVICGVCVLPFLAYLGAMVITKGTGILDNPFSGPPWYHTLGWVALAGLGIAFIATKLVEWIDG